MRTPHVALQRRKAAIEKFDHKVKTLETLLEADTIENVPDNMRPTTFVEWEDEELGVLKFSRNALYETDEEYIKLHNRMKVVLAALAKKRSRPSKVENDATRLKDKTEVLERKLQAFVNDYAMVRSELEDKNKEIIRLRLELQRIRENGSSITRLRPVKKPSDNEKF